MGLAIPSIATTSSILILAGISQISAVLWKSQPSSSAGYSTGLPYGSYSNYNGGYGSYGGYSGYGNYGRTRGDMGGWNGYGYGNGNEWGSNQGWGSYGGNYNKGWNRRECYDSRQCSRGECCRFRNYGRGVCEYVASSYKYGCMDGGQKNTWWQRPIYPSHYKGQPPNKMGRGGFCPPQGQSQGQIQPCRQDFDCQSFQKCCPTYKGQVCMHPVFT